MIALHFALSSRTRQRRVVVFAAAALALWATGCAHCPLCGADWRSGPKDRAGRDASSSIPPGTAVSGVVACHERIAILPTYRLVVRLEKTDGTPVARTAELPVASLPCPFSLELDAGAASSLSPGDVLALHAELRSSDTPILRTDSPAFIRVGDLGSVAPPAPELVLTRGR